MLFEKKMEPRCAYCKRGAQLDERTVLCTRKGVVPMGGHCWAFQYDPLRRTPPKPIAPDFSRLKEEDFAL